MNLQKELCNAASEGDDERVREALRAGASPDAVWDPERAMEESRQLHDSIESFRERSDTPEILKNLIDDDFREGQIERTASGPWSHDIPIHCAAESGNPECVRLLLDAGADVQALDNSQRNALFDARGLEVARMLVDAGLDPEYRDSLDWTVLDHAVGEEDPDRVRMLIDLGCDVNGTHDRGFTVFMSSVSSGRHPEVPPMLVRAGANPLAVTELGFNAFHAAIDVSGESAEEESIRWTFKLLKNLGVDIERRNGQGRTPLTFAIDEGIGREVKILLEVGADPNNPAKTHTCGADSCDFETQHPLLAAVDCVVDVPEKVEALLEAGADVAATNERDNTASAVLLTEILIEVEDEEEFDRLWDGFWAGLSALDYPELSEDRREFTDAVREVLRPYLAKYFEGVPVDDGEFDQKFRDEHIASLEILIAYEMWNQSAQV